MLLKGCDRCVWGRTAALCACVGSFIASDSWVADLENDRMSERNKYELLLVGGSLLVLQRGRDIYVAQGALVAGVGGTRLPIGV